MTRQLFHSFRSICSHRIAIVQVHIPDIEGMSSPNYDDIFDVLDSIDVEVDRQYEAGQQSEMPMAFRPKPETEHTARDGHDDEQQVEEGVEEEYNEEEDYDYEYESPHDEEVEEEYEEDEDEEMDDDDDEDEDVEIHEDDDDQIEWNDENVNDPYFEPQPKQEEVEDESALYASQLPTNPLHPLADPFPLTSQLATVIRTLESLTDTTKFVTDITGESASQFKDSRFGQALIFLRGACIRVHFLLVKATDGGSLYCETKESDVVPYDDMLFNWTAECNTFLLGLQAVLEGKVRCYLDTMEEIPPEPQLPVEEKDEWKVDSEDEDWEMHDIRQEAWELTNNEDQWTLLEQNEKGDMESRPESPVRQEPPQSIATAVEQQVFNILDEKTDEDLVHYAFRLNQLKEDLDHCVHPTVQIPYGIYGDEIDVNGAF